VHSRLRGIAKRGHRIVTIDDYNQFGSCQAIWRLPDGYLAASDPRYCGSFTGSPTERHRAYHQGTVWPWLLGPFVDAWLKVYPNDRAGARQFLDGLVPHLDEGCIGSINEIFDAEPPFTPRGCIAQAWSIAEILRAWVKTSEEQ